MGNHSVDIWNPLSEQCFSDTEFSAGKEVLLKAGGEALDYLQNIKLYGVGPIDKRPSTDQSI